MNPQLFLSLIESLGLAALVSTIYSALNRSSIKDKYKTIFFGITFGIAAIAAMMKPVELGDGLIFDARVVMLTLAGAYGGWISGAIAIVIAAAYRFFQGGLGIYAGMLGILIAGAVGTIFAWAIDKPYRLSDHAALGVLASLQILSLFALPWDLAIDLLAHIGPLLAIVNLIGVLTVGSFLKWEEGRETTVRTMKLDANIDFLTKLSNRRRMDDIARSFDDPATSESPDFTIVIFDIDRFKHINDKYGHAAGDKVLEEIAARIKNSFRKHDDIFRYGGEEFVALVKNSQLDDVMRRAERVRTAVQERSITYGQHEIRVTLSAGVAANAGASSFKELLEAADQALYQAKDAGRNQIKSLVVEAKTGKRDDSRLHTNA